MLLAVRCLVSVGWSEGIGDRYYWQHCSWVNSDDFDNNAQMNLAILSDMRLLYTNQVLVHSIRWYIPHTTTVHYQVIYDPPQSGFQPSQENYNILIAARWRMNGADGSYTYHLHRQPMGEDYLVNGSYTPDGYVQQQTRMNTFIAQGIYRTQTGALITEGEVVSTPVQWQLRHGTKRRRRRFWLTA